MLTVDAIPRMTLQCSGGVAAIVGFLQHQPGGRAATEVSGAGQPSGVLRAASPG
jgi:hypothetical protein